MLAAGSPTETNWSSLQKIIFRFSFIFFGLYIIPFPVNYLPVLNSWLGWIYEFWNWLVPHAGKYILHLSYDITVTPIRNGDATWNYVQMFLILSGAMIGTLIWSLLDRHRNNYQRLLYWFTVAVRYYLAFNLIAYGSRKVFKSQFPVPNIYRLTETYGQSSPMGLAWTFLGYSKGFNYFMGWAEIIGGLLLLFRKTKTFGALFCMTVTANIVAINFCFDVPVKIFSSMLFLMTVFIAAPDIQRLFQFFILNRISRLKSYGPSIKSGKWKTPLLAIKTVFIFYMLYTYTIQAIDALTQYGDEAPKPKLYGNYRVEAYYKYTDIIPPLVTDKTRWNRIILSDFNHGSVQMMDDTLQAYNYDDNPDQSEIKFLDRFSNQLKYSFTYLVVDKDHIEMKSKDPDGSIYMKLVRLDPGEFPLMKRGFHWINEYPLNR
jgi:hypothetical protein